MSLLHEKKKADKFNITMNVMIVVFVVVLVSSTSLLVYRLINYNKGKKTYSRIAEKYTKEIDSKDIIATSDRKKVKNNDKNKKNPRLFLDKAPIEVDFKSLSKVNKEVTGWLYQPGTGISYPVMKTHDNSFYLHHMINRQYNYSGALFMHCNNKDNLRDNNIIIYGHNMRNGTMFGTLDNYKSKDYYDKHPVLYYLTQDKNYRLDIYSAYVANENSDSYKISFKSDKKYRLYVESLIRKSVVKTLISTKEIGKTITLSTCAYDFKDARFVIHANLVEIE